MEIRANILTIIIASIKYYLRNKNVTFSFLFFFFNLCVHLLLAAIVLIEEEEAVKSFHPDKFSGK